MSAKSISMSTIKQVILLHERGVGIKQIARQLNLSKNTVKKYLRQLGSSKELLTRPDHELEKAVRQKVSSPAADASRKRELEGLFPSLVEELKRPGVTLWLLWQEYKHAHASAYSYPRFCHYFRQWKKSQGATMHFTYQPADKLFIDFTGKHLYYVDPPTGELIETQVYVAILGYSQYLYVQACPSQKKEDFIDCTEKALHYFGGAPQVLICDNLKAGVKKASKYEAELNEAFRDFANHYSTCVLAARSYKPRDKAPVENAVKIVYSRIFAPLRNKVFHSLEELNQAIAEQLKALNQASFQQKQDSRKACFEREEQALLTPLATQRYEHKSQALLTVMKNTHIQLREDFHYYSVPYAFIGKRVKVVYSHHHVRVFYQGNLIAYHPRHKNRHGYTTSKDHLPSTHQFVHDWSEEKFLSWARGISPQTEHFIQKVMERARYPEQAYRSCVGILSMTRKVGKQRLISAIHRAAYMQEYNYTTVKRILENNLDLAEQYSLFKDDYSLPDHDNIRGEEAYQ